MINIQSIVFCFDVDILNFLSMFKMQKATKLLSSFLILLTLMMFADGTVLFLSSNTSPENQQPTARLAVRQRW